HTKPWLVRTTERKPESGPQTITPVGIVVPTDVRPGDVTSCSMTLVPQAYGPYPVLRVLPFKVPLSSGGDGKPTLQGLWVDLGFGPGPAEGPVRCKAPEGSGTLHVVVSRDGGTTPVLTSDLPYQAAPSNEA